MGSDSNVSWGITSEDVGEVEEEGRVQRVFEQEAWIELVIEEVPESGVESLEADLVLAGADAGAEAGGS